MISENAYVLMTKWKFITISALHIEFIPACNYFELRLCMYIWFFLCVSLINYIRSNFVYLKYNNGQLPLCNLPNNLIIVQVSPSLCSPYLHIELSTYVSVCLLGSFSYFHCCRINFTFNTVSYLKRATLECSDLFIN